MIERLAREQIRLVRPGETVYTYSEKDANEDQSHPATQQKPAK
jgi:hypothetical protein